MFRHTKVKNLPFQVYFFSVSGLIVIGLLVSLYLSISHYRVHTDVGYQSFCAISKAINCDSVSQSRYSIILGVPLAVWGIIGYTFLMSLLPVAWRHRQRIWPSLFFFSIMYSGTSVGLAMVSTLLIKSYCLMCVATYMVNFFLVYFTWLIHKRFDGRSISKAIVSDLSFLLTPKKSMVIVVSIFLFVVLLTIQFFPRYWEIVAPVQTTELANGLTKDGHPWIGAESPELIITEYTDYLCFQCKKMHFFLRRLIAEHPQKIRLVHRNYPMDHKINPIVNEPFHEGAGSLALIAIYAATQDKFWIMNDRLFEMAGKKRTIDLKELAVKTGLNFRELKGALQDTNIRNQLNRDILSGMKLGINGTPAYLIDDKLYLGQIPPDILKKALE